jgi:DNA-directed RNA polymerase subunit RPC12/RpoP
MKYFRYKCLSCGLKFTTTKEGHFTCPNCLTNGVIKIDEADLEAECEK